MIPRTTWADKDSPYTGKIPIKEVPIPQHHKKTKGTTKYDAEFARIIKGKTALEVHEDNFQTLRRAMQRYITFNNLRGKLTARQQLNPMTRTITLWFELKKASNDE